jgi:predicted PilT family ATPase
VAATDMHGLPYTSLVAFASDSELKFVIFATFRDTRKFGNLTRNKKISLLVDNRKNQNSDFQETVAVTIEGKAAILDMDQDTHEKHVKLYLKKHPYLDSFLNSPNCALIRVDVEKYHFVSRFQNVDILVVK